MVCSFVSVGACCVKESFFLQHLQLHPAVRFQWQCHGQIELGRILFVYIEKIKIKPLLTQLNINRIAVVTAELS